MLRLGRGWEDGVVAAQVKVRATAGLPSNWFVQVEGLGDLLGCGWDSEVL